MKKSIIILIMALTASVAPGFAQADRNPVYKVGMGEFTYSAPQKKKSAGQVVSAIAEVLLAGKTSQTHPEYADAVRASVVSGLSNAIRLRGAEGASDDMAFYADGTILNISSITKTEPAAKKGNPDIQYFKGLISVTVNLKNAADGSVEDSHTFSVTDTDLSWINSREQAMNNALKRLTGLATRYYNGLFPLRAEIVESGNVKKDKQKEVYIDLGEDDGVYADMEFTVYTVATVAGRESRSEIGRLKIKEVKGNELSLCSVKRGGDKIKAALDANTPLVIVSR